MKENKKNKFSNNNDFSSKIDILEKRIFKFLTSFSLIILLLIWDFIPFEILKAFNIGLETIPDNNIKIVNLLHIG